MRYMKFITENMFKENYLRVKRANCKLLKYKDLLKKSSNNSKTSNYLNL